MPRDDWSPSRSRRPRVCDVGRRTSGGRVGFAHCPDAGGHAVSDRDGFRPGCSLRHRPLQTPSVAG